MSAPEYKLPDLFNPETGVWATNIRDAELKENDAKDQELRESMKAHGWLPSLPAIQDENGVLITGHRRLAVAEELGLELNIKTIHFGEGPAGEAARAALAIASNVGAKPLSAADRKKIAADLYGDGTKFSMTEIAELLKVSAMTVSRDLQEGLTDVKPPKSKGGRPRKPKTDPKPEPKPGIAVKVTSTTVGGGTITVSKPEPKPEPEADETPVKVDMFSVKVNLDIKVLSALTAFGNWVEGLNDEARAQLTEDPTFMEMIEEISQQVLRVRSTLKVGHKVAPVETAEEDAADASPEDLAIERVGNNIIGWLIKHGPATRGLIRDKAVYSKDREPYFDGAWQAVLDDGAVVPTADGKKFEVAS